jgi:SAM-dependent methyltransferase
VFEAARFRIAARVARIFGDEHATPPEGKVGVLLLGHRGYVGGLWDEIGRLQFDFLLREGLRPTDVLLDVGCGALRGGVHFVRYLNPGHYIGLDKEPALIRAGKRELGRAMLREKKPAFVISADFDFSTIPRKPTFALAQSLFSHLEPAHIEACLRRLRPAMAAGGRFYATFNEREQRVVAGHSHSHAFFAYRRDELAEIGVTTGWQPSYVGDIGHPRGQVVMLFTPHGRT